jgi:putative Mn2+ efflux pump MntP
MTLAEMLVLALALSADAFSVGTSLGLRHRSPRQTFRLAFHFGLFQALLPLLGAFLGNLLVRQIEAWDHWIAFGLLAFLGVHMIRAAIVAEERPGSAADLTRGWSLVGFSLAVSIDALAAGVALPAAGAPILLAVTLFGIVTGFATFAAVRLAASIASRVGTRIEILAGLVLIGLGVKILNDHLHFIRLG